MKQTILISLILSLASITSAQAANLYAGKAIAAAVCSQCHGIKALPAGAPFPALDGSDRSYLQSALTKYRNKQRKSDIMNNIAASLSDKDIANVTAYYSRLR